METIKEKKRWPIALIIIAVVVIISTVIIYSYRDAPGRIPIAAISSDSGETIVTWKDSAGIYAQRLNLSGQSLWEEDGLLIAESPPDKSYTWISDGLGGAIFTWYESTDIDNEDPDYFSPVTFYAQRINADGEPMWDDGVLIGDSNRHGVDFPKVIPDSTGGAIFVWNDYKPFRKALHEDILCLKRFDAGGQSLWGIDAVIVAASTSYHELTEEEIAAGIKGTWTRSWPTYSGQFAAVSDGTDGVIVIWEEEITSKSERVFAQRFNDRGDAVWPDRLTVADEGLLSAESDGAGGAIIWTPEGTVYSGIGRVGRSLIVHISGNGEILTTREYAPGDVFISDGLDGFIRIRIEEDPPSGPPWDRRTTLYVQGQDSAGKSLWPEVKVIDPGEKEQFAGLEYIVDGTGGIIIVWQLQKDSVPIGGIIAQRIDADGTLFWGEEGIPVYGGSRIRYQGIAEVLEDGSGGVTVIAALGTGALSGDMVYAQKLDAEGNRLWGDGIMINR
jgi:hypothetical protein